MKAIFLILSVAIVFIVCHLKMARSNSVFKFDREAELEEFDKSCPNNRTKCKETQTCCKTKHNSYHCCKYRNAVCCPDRFHCCPHGSSCDTKRKRCTKNVDVAALLPSKPVSDPMEWNIDNSDSKLTETCPNKKTRCKDTQTCCITKKGNYHCCKYPNAVCCSDKYHCCPADSTCDLKRKKCNSNGVHPMIRLSLSLNLPSRPQETLRFEKIVDNTIDKDVTCPNNKTKCKDTKTCCITKSGNYYCCPHKNAVCCSDKWLCCPEDSKCDVKNKKCISNAFTNNMEINEVNIKEESQENKKSNMAGCCSDPENCCQKGSKCDLQTNKCLSETETENNFEEKTPSKMWSLDEINKPVESEAMCPNNKTKCKDTKTCCVTLHGNYYCCPHKNAVCCSDKWSCCPEGNTCDVKNKKCNPSIISKTPLVTPTEIIPISNQIPSLKIFLTFLLNMDKTCDNSCSADQKCCTMKNGKFGCCGYKKGICCSDFITCCPPNTDCDIENKVCIPKITSNIPPRKIEKIGTDICPDNKSECFSWQTCCPIGNGEYGCCPKENATCCSDQVSCCAHNTKCDIQNHRCIENDIEHSFEQIHAKNTKLTKRIPLSIFDSNFELNFNKKCNESDTFCSISSSKYGCCLYKSGQCCSDMASCCPGGFKCTTDGCSLI